MWNEGEREASVWSPTAAEATQKACRPRPKGAPDRALRALSLLIGGFLGRGRRRGRAREGVKAHRGGQADAGHQRPEPLPATDEKSISRTYSPVTKVEPARPERPDRTRFSTTAIARPTPRSTLTATHRSSTSSSPSARSRAREPPVTPYAASHLVGESSIPIATTIWSRRRGRSPWKLGFRLRTSCRPGVYDAM